MVRGSMSHWLHTSATWPVESTAGVAGPSSFDICIVGGGVTGCSLAYHLRRLDPRCKILVVEARGISEGATGRNGGLMWPSLNAPWPTTVAQYGEAMSKQLIEFELHAFQDISNFITDHDLAEELQFSLFPDGALTLCETQEELDAELADMTAQVNMGIKPLVSPLTRDQLTQRLGNHHFVGGLYQEKVARLTAVRLSHALLKRAVAIEPNDKVTVMQHTRVAAVERLPAGSGARFRIHCRPEDAGTMVKFGDGVSDMHYQGMASDMHFTAGRVVHCTNGYNELLPQLTQLGWLIPVRNQVTVTAPLPLEHPLPVAAFYARGGYVYWSRRHDDRVVIGGFRDVTPHMEWGTRDDSAEGLDQYVSTQMKAFLPAVLPSLFSLSSAHTDKRPTTLSAPAPRSASSTSHRDSHSYEPVVLSASLTSASTLENHTSAGGNRPLSHTVPVPLQYELEWSGILGFTKDRWPLWGALPPELSCASPTTTHGPTYEYACMGFSGHGMTRAYTCARNLALLLMGKATEPCFPSRVFSPMRVLHTPGGTSKL